MIVNTSNQILDQIEMKHCLDDVRLMDEFQHITGELVGRSFFGNSLLGQINGKPMTTELAELIGECMDVTISPFNILVGSKAVKLGILPHHKRLMKRIKRFRDACESIIEKRKTELKISTNNRKDLLQALLEMQETSTDEAFTTVEIIDEFITFFLAGMDTTGHTLGMIMYYLSIYPEHLVRIKEEVDNYIIDEKAIDQSRLNKMVYTTAFIKETLRVATPVPFLFHRTALEDHKLGPLFIKKETIVNASKIYA